MTLSQHKRNHSGSDRIDRALADLDGWLLTTKDLDGLGGQRALSPLIKALIVGDRVYVGPNLDVMTEKMRFSRLDVARLVFPTEDKFAKHSYPLCLFETPVPEQAASLLKTRLGREPEFDGGNVVLTYAEMKTLHEGYKRNRISQLRDALVHASDPSSVDYRYLEPRSLYDEIVYAMLFNRRYDDPDVIVVT